LVPIHWPGISPESTAALREVLKDNHERWHAFFNDHGFHKCVAASNQFSMLTILTVIQLTMPSQFGLLEQTVPLSEEAIVTTARFNAQRSNLLRLSPQQTLMIILETKGRLFEFIYRNYSNHHTLSGSTTLTLPFSMT
jgi:hypothetical protein